MCVWTDASFRKQGSLKAHTRVIRLTLVGTIFSQKNQENVNAKQNPHFIMPTESTCPFKDELVTVERFLLL